MVPGASAHVLGVDQRPTDNVDREAVENHMWFQSKDYFNQMGLTSRGTTLFHRDTQVGTFNRRAGKITLQRSFTSPEGNTVEAGSYEFLEAAAQAMGVPEINLQKYLLAHAKQQNVADDAELLKAVHGKKASRPPATRQPLKMFRATDMAPSKQIEWLAHGQVPIAGFTVLVGDEGIGKSLWWVWMAAHITTGRACHGYGIEAGKPRDVVLILAENDWQSVDRPRLEAAGADMSHIIVLSAHVDGSGAPMFDAFTQNFIKNEVSQKADIALIVADPWLDTVPAELSVRDGQQAKLSLRPWREITVKLNCAAVLIAHTNRMATASVRDKYGATAELRKTARMTQLAQRDEETGRLIIGPDKSNITPAGVKASEFVIKTVVLPGMSEATPYLERVGDSEVTAAELFEAKAEDSAAGEGRSTKQEQEEILLSVFEDSPGWVPTKKAQARAAAAGLSRDQSSRTRKRLNIESKKGKGEWFWVLPDKLDEWSQPTPWPPLKEVSSRL